MFESNKTRINFRHLTRSLLTGWLLAGIAVSAQAQEEPVLPPIITGQPKIEPYFPAEEPKLPALPPPAEEPSDILSVRSDGARNEAAGLKLGDSSSTVKDILGKPNGVFTSGGETVWMYKLGTVTFTKNQVSGLRLMSKEEFEKKEAARESMRMEREEKIAIENAEEFSEGQKVLDRVLNDKKFENQPATTRLNYWRAFMRQYPGIDVEEYYESAKAAAREEVELQRRVAAELAKQRLKDNENRPGFRNGVPITR